MLRSINRIRAEFLEMPGLRLKPKQIARLSGVDPVLCQGVLDALVQMKFLRLNADGTYMRASDGEPIEPRGENRPPPPTRDKRDDDRLT